MKNKLLKRTLAMTLALTVLGSTAPVGFNGSPLFVSTLTANADPSEGYTTSYDDTTKTAIIGGTLPENYKSTEAYVNMCKAEHIIFQKGTVLPKDCSQMFYNSKNLKSVDFEEADLLKVENAYQMFIGCINLETVNFKGTDFSNITTMAEMFRECNMLTDVIDLKASSEKLTQVNSLFENCHYLMSVDVNQINTKNVTDFNRMFMRCHNLRSVDLRGLDTSSATDMSWMFFDCFSLVSADTSKFDTSKVQNMSCMFDDCESLLKLDLSNFKTENCKDFEYMFSCCNALRELDISRFTISDDAKVNEMFGNHIVAKLKLGPGIKKITKTMGLNSAPMGWVNENEPNKVFSNFGYGKNAEFTNEGDNTYIKNPNFGSINGLGVTINQNGTFGIRIGVTLPDTLTEKEKESAYICCYSLRYNGHTEEKIPVKSDGNGGYYAVYRAYAKEMTARMQIFLSVNGEYVDEALFSIRQYADILFNDPEKYSKEQDLLKAMLLFGGAAQRKFNNYYSDGEADRGITYSKTVINSANHYSTPSDLEDLKYNGTSILLGSGIVQRHYFKLVTGDIKNYTFEVDGVKTTPVKKDETLYYVDATKNGAIMKLYDPSDIKVYKNSEPSKSIQFKYSVMDYVRLAQNNGFSGADLEVIKTLSWMADEAKTYFGIK